jgi:LmbE family N-acetylglucosaminyl deacetylase
VAFAAHPDDETLLTGGTLAKAAADGHRVVVVLATYGDSGLTTPNKHPLKARRAVEVERATAALGVHEVVNLGYGDSGYREPVRPAGGTLATIPVEHVAQRFYEILRQERPDVVLIHDSRGGYGHRDHVVCHRAGLSASQRAFVPIVLEATLPRELLRAGVRLLNTVGVRPGGVRVGDMSAWYAPRRSITHVIDVRRHVPAKLLALRAHASQLTGGDDIRALSLLSRLPAPLATIILGKEWFLETGYGSRPRRAIDIFSSSRLGDA